MDSETRNCNSCKGSGHTEPYTFDNGDTIPARKCSSCDGRGTFPQLDVDGILARIKGRKGLRSAPPKYTGADYNFANVRAYYVWRLARFHGGIDVTMPVIASTLVHGDPFIRELELLADAVAKRAFGTDLAAAYRWGNALGHSVTVPESMPATAFTGGPVLLASKPDEELPELC